MLAPVNVRAEGNPFVTEFPQRGQAKYLIAPAVGNQGSVPGHKLMEPTHCLNDTYSRPQIDMIGISHYHGYVEALQFFRGQRFNCSLAAYW